MVDDKTHACFVACVEAGYSNKLDFGKLKSHNEFYNPLHCLVLHSDLCNTNANDWGTHHL